MKGIINIIFFCGSLEQGKDGVGDYTILLATELVKQGHVVKAIALNDKHTSNDSDEVVPIENTFLSITRLTSLSPWKNRIAKAKEIVAEFTPDWISFQFVPYAYNEKGLPFRLAYQLKSVFKGYKLHIMHHELWVENVDPKGRLLAFFQKKIISIMHKVLQPNLSHTHVPAYADRLLKLGVKAHPLPVFSNIPFLNLQTAPIDNYLTVGFFSQVTFRTEIIDFLKNLSAVCLQKKINLKILVIGGSSAKVEKFINVIGAINEIKSIISHTGFLDAEGVSSALSGCTIGITPVPRHLLGKSGSVAAFLSHGIPVAAPYIKENYENFKVGLFDPDVVSAIILNADLDAIAIASENVSKIINRVTPKAVSDKFLLDLSLTQAV